MNDLKSLFVYVLALLIIGGASFNYLFMRPPYLQDNDKLRMFFLAGDRNTALDGYRLCVRLNRMEAIQWPDEVPVDCEIIYNRFRNQKLSLLED